MDALVELHPFVIDGGNFHALVTSQLQSPLHREQVHRRLASAERKAWLEETFDD